MFNCGQTITQESIFEPKTNSICGSVHVQDRMRASAMRARLTLHIWNSDVPKWTVTELTITIGWVLNKKKQTKMFARGKGLLLSLSLSIPVKQQQPNKSQTYSMTNSRLWHPSDPKHVLIISPWLPVGVYVISTHIPSGKISIQLLGIRAILASGVWNEAVKPMKEFRKNCLVLSYTQFSQLLLRKDTYLSCIRHHTSYFFCFH